MALSYAARLTKGIDYGICGTPEFLDNKDILEKKIEKLVQLIEESEYLVVHTGAGISTSCGIPDFRGPNGVWTKEIQQNEIKKIEKEIIQKKKKRKTMLEIHHKEVNYSSNEEEIKWEDCLPSLTHMALLGLLQAGKLKYIISQNVDGLHIKSGVSKEKLSELHGNVFMEKCEKCNKTFIRDFDIQGIGFKYTGRYCDKENCNGKLRDVLLDWHDALPEKDLKLAIEHSQKADLSLCLGTSLRVQPANSIPIETVKHGGKLIICNLQKTPKDRHAILKIHAKCDDIMREVMKRLHLKIPIFKKTEEFIISIKYKEIKENTQQNYWIFYVKPISSTSLRFIEKIDLYAIIFGNITIKEPFQFEWIEDRSINNKIINIDINIQFSSKCTAKPINIQYNFYPHLQQQEEIKLLVETVILDYNSEEIENEEKAFLPKRSKRSKKFYTKKIKL